MSRTVRNRIKHDKFMNDNSNEEYNVMVDERE